MNLVDYSPPKTPSLDEQRDALQKGIGRALQWAMAGCLEDAPLLEACLHDLRFDCQCEENRGAWLWQIIQAVNAEDRFRSILLEALQTVSDVGTGCQLCTIGVGYAGNGDEAFRSGLYRIVQEKPVKKFPRMGEREIIQLDGEIAFLFAAKLRGRELEVREWDWHDCVFIDEAVEQLGIDRINQAFGASTGQTTIRFRDEWHQQTCGKRDRKAPKKHAQRKKQITVGEVIAAADLSSNQSVNFQRWGMRADASDLETVFERLLSSRDPKAIANYLRVFSRRSLPCVVPEIISLYWHNDENVRRWTLNALEESAHPLVRELAEQELQKGVPGGRSLRLFVKNYQPGDEQHILECVDLPDEQNQLHWLLMDMVKVCESNSQADCSQLGVIAYALTPCTLCRYYAAKLLHSRGVAPSWLTEECRFDSNEDTRQLPGRGDTE